MKYSAVPEQEDVAPGSSQMSDRVTVDLLDTGHELRAQVNKVFMLALRIGVSLSLFGVAVIMLFASHHDTGNGAQASDYLANEYFPLFRYHWLIALFITLYGGAIFILHHFAHIEAAPLLGLEHSNHNYHMVMKIGLRFTMILFPCFLLYIMTILENHKFGSEHIYPMLALILCTLYSVYESFHSCYVRRLGANCGNIVAGVVFSPFIMPTFAMTYVADVLTSMPKALNDIEYTLCIYFAGLAWDDSYDPTEDKFGMVGSDKDENQCSNHDRKFSAFSHIVALLPFWFRLMQCLRALYSKREPKHAANAVKYSISIIVVLLSSVGNFKGESQHNWWIGFTVLSAVYSFFWDVRMDWGLGEWNAPNRGLRAELAFPAWVYYCAIVFDAGARGPYAIQISPGQTVVKQYNLLAFGMLEMAIWTMIRFEWEHKTREAKLAQKTELSAILDSQMARSPAEAHTIIEADAENKLISVHTETLTDLDSVGTLTDCAWFKV